MTVTRKSNEDHTVVVEDGVDEGDTVFNKLDALAQYVRQNKGLGFIYIGPSVSPVDPSQQGTTLLTNMDDETVKMILSHMSDQIDTMAEEAVHIMNN